MSSSLAVPKLLCNALRVALLFRYTDFTVCGDQDLNLVRGVGRSIIEMRLRYKRKHKDK
jgi:hypothetical protein